MSDGKKLFFDWLKMNAVWAKRRMVEIVKPVYADLRDANKFVKSVLNSRTYVRRTGDTLYVSFPRQRSRRNGEGLRRLCEELNSHGNIDLGLRFRKLVFSVRDSY